MEINSSESQKVNFYLTLPVINLGYKFCKNVFGYQIIPRTKMNLLSCSLFLGRENLSVQKIILFARWKHYYGYLRCD